MNTTTHATTANTNNRRFRAVFDRIVRGDAAPTARRPERTGYKWIIAGTGMTLVLAACGGGDDENLTRDFILQEVMEGTGLAEEDAACVVDTALDQFTLEQLATMSSDSPDPAVESEVVSIATDCLLNSDNLDEIIANEMDDDADEDAADVSDAPDAEPVGLATDPTPDDSAPPTTAPAVTVPETTLPPTTLPPTTLPPTTEREFVFAGTPFCAASTDYYVGVGAVDVLLEEGAQTAAFDAAFAHMFESLDRAVESAPLPELQAEAELARMSLRPVHRALVDLDYDVLDRDPSEFGVDEEIDVLNDSHERLEDFLTDSCDQTIDGLNDAAATLAIKLAAETAPVTAGDGVAVTDQLDRIYVEVPAAWTSVDGAAGSEIANLVVGPDAGQFLDSWAADGVRIRITDEGENADWTAPLTGLEHFSACTMVSTDTYDDGMYFGTINIFEECSRAGTDAAVIIATNTDGFDLAVMVEIQMVEWDQDIADLILSSFQVR